MTLKRPSQPPVFDHDDAQRRVTIDLRRLERSGLVVSQPDSYSADRIKALRERLDVSQAVFALLLNTSRSAVRQWEQGSRSPTGSALRLLQILERRGIDALLS